MSHRQLHLSNQLQYLVYIHVQYLGETGDLRRRINNHRPKKKTNTIIRPVGEHFNLSGHKLEDTTAMFVSDRRQEE